MSFYSRFWLHSSESGISWIIRIVAFWWGYRKLKCVSMKLNERDGLKKENIVFPSTRWVQYSISFSFMFKGNCNSYSYSKSKLINLWNSFLDIELVRLDQLGYLTKPNIKIFISIDKAAVWTSETRGYICLCHIYDTYKGWCFPGEIPHLMWLIITGTEWIHSGRMEMITIFNQSGKVRKPFHLWNLLLFCSYVFCSASFLGFSKLGTLLEVSISCRNFKALN